MRYTNIRASLRFLAALSLAVLSVSAVPAVGQTKLKRITVLALKDRTGSGASMNISEKAADALLSKLAETGKFQVVDRESLAAIQSEKNLKFDADFNPANAPKSGLLAVCDIMVTGQIDEFSANQSTETTGNYISKKTEVEGTTALKLSLRVISVETGQILGAPTARVEKTGVLAKSSASTIIQGVGHSNSTADTKSALLKLVDSEIEEISEQLSAKIATGAAALGGAAPGAVASAPVLPKFVGMDEGLAMINKGSAAGVKIGDAFDIVHPTTLDLIDPETNQHVVRRKKLCTLVISSVDESTAEGKCDGGTPQKGDEIRAATK